jgi:type I restriction enzyme S subunit
MNEDALPAGWVRTRLGEITAFEYGKGLREDKRDQKGKVPVYGSNGIVGYHSFPLIEKPSIIIGRKGAAGYVHLSMVPCWPIDTTYYIIPPDELNLVFLYYLLSTLNLNSLDKSTAIPGLNRNDAYALKIPLPPLLEQRRIVTKIEELFTKLDAGAVDAVSPVSSQSRLRGKTRADRG